MGRRTTFVDQTLATIRWLLSFIVLLSLLFASVMRTGGVISFPAFAAIVLLTGLFLALFVFWFRLRVLSPYERNRQSYLDFIHQRRSKDLLDEDYQIFPGMNEILQLLLDRQDEIQLSTKQAEFLALQNQINPHFLYNTLEAIRGDALSAGLDNIADTTEALSTFFRYTITNTGNLVTLGEELENIENYFLIQKYRFGDKLKMEIDMPEDRADEILRLKFPKLILQPLIENAIFHGLERKAEGGTIQIRILPGRTHVLLIVRDDGVGMPEDVLDSINERLSQISAGIMLDDKKKTPHIALNNVARRIKLLFGEDCGIHLYSVPGIGTEVHLKIPAITPSQRGIRT